MFFLRIFCKVIPSRDSKPLHFTGVTHSKEEVTGEMPVEEVTGKMPVEEVTGKMPVEEVTGKMPVEEVTGKMPVEEVTGKMPVPREGCGQKQLNFIFSIVAAYPES